MSENLFLGDSTYPHTPKQTLSMRLRINDDNGLTLETDCLMSEAADRIEQLETQVQMREYAAKSAKKQNLLLRRINNARL